MSFAYAPGHVSGLFAIFPNSDPMQKGSRGVGWTLGLGAFAHVREGTGQITIDGDEARAEVTRRALAHLAPDAKLDVDLFLQLPVGHGFGMSGAGTLAACLAACDTLGIEPEFALEATHRAEVEEGTGLGDAIGCWFGGGEIRLRPGCPPHGWAMRVEPTAGTQILYCIMGQGMETKDVIENDAWIQETRTCGDEAIDRIMEAGREQAWPRMLAESHWFSRRLGLMPANMLELGNQLPKDVIFGQCMLGTTMWVVGDEGDLERSEAMLEPHGTLFRSPVDPNGARLVRAIPTSLQAIQPPM